MSQYQQYDPLLLALREPEPRYGYILDSLRGVVYINANGEVIAANPAAEDILGISSGELLGRNLHDPRWIVIQEDGTRLSSHDFPGTAALREGKVIKDAVSGVFNPALNDYAWLRVTATPLFQEGSDRPYQVYLTFDDITELKSVKKKLAITQERLRYLISTSPATIYSCAAEGDFSATFVSDHVRTQLGYEPSDFIGNCGFWHEHLHPDEKCEVLRQAAEALAAGGGSFVYRFRRSDGTYCWIRDSLRVVTGSGGRREVVGYWADVSARREAELAQVRLLDELREKNSQLERLSRRVVEVQETERRAVARELHDEIGQYLTGLRLTLEALPRLSEGETAKCIHNANNLINELVCRVREMSLNLRPSILDDLGLLPTLLWHVERFTSHTGVKVDFKHLDLEQRRLSPECEIAAFRIVQEALTNSARHAGIKEVSLRVWLTPDALCLMIQDAGQGFDPQDVSSSESTGLTGMRERTLRLGGTFKLESAPGAGTMVFISIPR